MVSGKILNCLCAKGTCVATWYRATGHRRAVPDTIARGCNSLDRLDSHLAVRGAQPAPAPASGSRRDPNPVGTCRKTPQTLDGSPLSAGAARVLSGDSLAAERWSAKFR